MRKAIGHAVFPLIVIGGMWRSPQEKAADPARGPNI